MKLNYHDYRSEMDRRLKAGNDKWIYDILDGISEQSTIVQRNSQFILVRAPNNSSFKPHLLGIVKDRRKNSIRDLVSEDIPLVRKMETAAIEYIRAHYPSVRNKPIKAFFHFPPSTFHLHLHVGVDHPSSRNIYLNKFVAQLKKDPNYYRQEKPQDLRKKTPTRTHRRIRTPRTPRKKTTLRKKRHTTSHKRSGSYKRTHSLTTPRRRMYTPTATSRRTPKTRTPKKTI